MDGTPARTVSSILSSYEDFRRVRRGYYELAGNAELPAARVERREQEPAFEPSVPSPLERDPSDLLADLRAAADSADEAQSDADMAPHVEMESVGATG